MARKQPKPPTPSMRAALAAASEVIFAREHPHALDLISEITHRMMGDMQLFPVICPELFAVMFEVAARRFPCAKDYFRYILRARRFADDPEQLKRIHKEWRQNQYRFAREAEAIAHPTWHAERMASLAEVVSMAAWLDSRRRVAGKGGER